MILTIAAETPNVTDWMQGWGSVVGVVVGLIAAVITGILLIFEIRSGRQARGEAAEDRAEAAEDRALAAAERRDAAMGHARTVVISDVKIAGVETGILTQMRFSVANYGQGPVLDVVPEFVIVGGTEIRHEFDGPAALGPGEVLEIDEVFRPSVDAARTGEKLTGQALFDAIGVAVTFTDMTGARWHRVESGQPERVLE